MVEDSRRLRCTFDTVATRYQDARPEYPDELFDVVIDTAGLRQGDRLLEVGCASGKATLPLARRGFRITCVELGAELASAARVNLAGFRDVTAVESAFETWTPPSDERFDLVFAATAWHWLDPAIRYEQAWRCLRPGGHLAIWSRRACRPGGRRSVLRGDPGGLRRDRRGTGRGHGRAAAR